MELIVFGGFGPIGDAGMRVLERLRPSTVIMGLDDEDDDVRGVDPSDYSDRWSLRPQWRGGKIEATLGWLHARGYRIGVHVWGRPVRAWTSEQAAQVRSIHATVPLDVVMVDHERHGLKLDPSKGGYADHAEYVADVQRLWHAPPYTGLYPTWPELWCAVYGYPGERHRDLIGVCSTTVPMVYGDAKHTGADPLPVYRRSVELVRAALPEDGRLIMGIGAYDQARPGLSAETMVTRTLDALAAEGVDAVAVWSLPWLVRSPRVVDALARRPK